MEELLTKEQVILLKDAHRRIRGKKSADRIKAVITRLGGYGYVTIQNVIQGAVAASSRLQSVFQKFVSTVVLFLIYLGGIGPVSVIAKCFQKKFLRETHHRSSWRNIESFNSDSMF